VFRGTFTRRLTHCGVVVIGLVRLGLPLVAQKVEYSKVPPAVLEERLNDVADKNSEREQVMLGLFRTAGCDRDALEEQPVKGSRTPNVICTLKGTSDARIIVGAHYDKVTRSNGVIDNWTGACLLPSLFEGLHAKPHRFTFVFLSFTDEEKGLVGSEYSVSRLTPEERSRIRAMVNIDSLGLSDTEVWLSRADKDLANAAGAVAHALKLPLSAMNVDRVGLSDSGPFLKRKIPVIDFHSVTQETFPILHSPQDRIQAVRLTEYERSFELLVAYLAYLDMTLADSVPSSR
jgi:putative aminopeptidase FrvX